MGTFFIFSPNSILLCPAIKYPACVCLSIEEFFEITTPAILINKNKLDIPIVLKLISLFTIPKIA